MSALRKEVFSAVEKLMPEIWNLTGTVGLMDVLCDLYAASSPLPKDFETALIDHLRFEEGVQYKVYKDHLGYPTIGVGRLLDRSRGGGLSQEEEALLLANEPKRHHTPMAQWVLTDGEVNYLLQNDIDEVMAGVSHLPAFKKVKDNPARSLALASMAFQMGLEGLKKFKNTLKMVEWGRYPEAADNMLKSKWARQTPGRADRVAEMMRTGVMKW